MSRQATRSAHRQHCGHTSFGLTLHRESRRQWLVFATLSDLYVYLSTAGSYVVAEASLTLRSIDAATLSHHRFLVNVAVGKPARRRRS